MAEHRYQALFKAARDAILIMNRDSGILIDVNSAAEKLIEEYQEVLEDDYDLDSSRLWFSRIFVPDWRKLATVFDAFHQMIEDLGPLTEEKRKELMQAWSKGKMVQKVQ